MRRVPLQAWMVPALLLGSVMYAVAEELTLTTYYPSPRGVYRELRVGTGLGSAPQGFLNIAGDGSAPGLKVEAGGGTQLIVLGNGNVGIGLANPSEALTVSGNGSISGNLNVGGTGSFGSNVTVGGDLTVTGDTTTTGLTANGPALFNGAVTITTGGPDVGKVWSAVSTGGDGAWDYPKYAP